MNWDSFDDGKNAREEEVIAKPRCAAKQSHTEPGVAGLAQQPSSGMKSIYNDDNRDYILKNEKFKIGQQ